MNLTWVCTGVRSTTMLLGTLKYVSLEILIQIKYQIMDYEQKYKEAKRLYQTATPDQRYVLESLFPELAESEDEKIRKALIRFHKSTIDVDGIKGEDIIAWLEKQGEQKSILNVPLREVILSIWDLGNEWKELTNGRISTEYGTQLDYIQKHWTESEYYLREKQGEQTI